MHFLQRITWKCERIFNARRPNSDSFGEKWWEERSENGYDFREETTAAREIKRR